MKRNLHIDLIKHFIIEGKTKTFEEVDAFSQEIGATLEELEEAIYLIAKDSPHITPLFVEDDKEHIEHHINKRKLRITYLKIATIPLVAVFIVAGLFIMFDRNSQQSMIAQSKNSATPQSLIPHIEPEQVFANHRAINSDEVFSYPKIPITLTYKNKPKKEVVGFFPYWMLGKHQEISINGYTSVNIFGLEADGKGNIITVVDGKEDLGWLMWNDKKLDLFLARLQKQKIKRLITIKAFNNANIEALAVSDEAQERFISNALQLVNSKNLDGINIDFEYIGVADEDVKLGFVRLIANLRSTLHDSYPLSQLTVDTYISSGANPIFFDVERLKDHVDAFVIMGYDIHTPKGAPGPVSPLEGPSGIIGYMESYLKRVEPEKLILALPYYGYDWPIDPAGNGDILSYAQIADMTAKQKVSWNEQTQTPYYTYNDGLIERVLHFENARSLGLKYDYVNAKKLKGVGIWAMGYDGYNHDLEKMLFDKFGQANF